VAIYCSIKWYNYYDTLLSFSIEIEEKIMSNKFLEPGIIRPNRVISSPPVRWIASGGGRSWGSTSDWHASWRQTAGAAAVGCGGKSLGVERELSGVEWLGDWLRNLWATGV